ncbi:MAG: laccase domain-containing protein [Planctomycetota bacterium]
MSVNVRFLIECGVPPASIEIAEECTYGEADLLHSFRRDGVAGGHHGLVAAWPAS